MTHASSSVVAASYLGPQGYGNHQAHLRPWPELEGRDGSSQEDSVHSRLWRVNDKGYELCLLWPDVDKANELVRPGREKYSPEVWRAVDAFLSGRRV